MTRYVLGFLLNADNTRVLLLKKARGPAENIGKWNGVGGKIEEGESSRDAMRREGTEEMGLDVAWTYFGHMGGAHWVCDLYCSTVLAGSEPSTQDPTEPVMWCAVRGGAEAFFFASNVPVLIHAALLHMTSTSRVSIILAYE